jgi:hypothetical protein
MGVLVHVLESDLVRMPMRVGHPIVGVLVLVLVMLVAVRGVRMRVPHVAVLVLVCVRRVMCVLVGHTTPVIA